MSVKALCWVFEHSPYEGSMRLVHLTVANVVNDQHDNLVWLAHRAIAERAKVSSKSVQRAITKMVNDGFLERVAQESGLGPGHPQTYRFLFPGTVDTLTTVAAGTVDTLTTVAAGTVDTLTTVEPPNGGHPVPQLWTSRPRIKGELKELKFARSKKRSPKRLTDDPVLEQAHKLAQLAFDQPVKPAGREGFVKARSTIRAVLESGVPAVRVESAIQAGVDVWSIGGLQTALAKLPRSSEPVSYDAPSVVYR